MRTINLGGEDIWVSVSEGWNDNSGVTHIAHLKTHQEAADKCLLSPIHFIVEETRRESE